MRVKQVHGVLLVSVAAVMAWVVAPRAQTPPIDLPTERASNVFYAQTMVNGIGPMWLSLDTGANLTVLDPDAARSAGLTIADEGARPDVGSGAEVTPLGRIQGVTLRVGRTITFAQRSMFVVPVRGMAASLGHPIDGVLGIDFMRRYVVEFDYAGGSVRFYEPSDASNFSYRGSGEILPVDLKDNVLTVRAAMTMPDGEKIDAKWLVDTGRTGRPILNAPFVKRHRLVERFAGRAGLGMSRGVNGYAISRTATLTAIHLGAMTIAGPSVDLSEASSGLTASDEYDGHLGALLLSQFKLLIDFPGRRLILEEKNKHAYPH